MRVEMPPSVAEILTPKPRLTVSEWARWKPFEIREKGAVNPGPYDVSMTPYMREPLDMMGRPEVRRMNWVICPQGGKTKALEVGVTYLMDYRPTNMLYIRPTEPDLVEAFNDRWKSVIETNLPELIPPTGAWVVTGNNPSIELKNQKMYGAAVTVARHLTSRSTPVVLYDETDTGEDTGNSLGNALDAAADRQMAANELLCLTLGCSSAKFDTGSNWVAYDKQSDRREYWEPCPHCGRYQPLPSEQGDFLQQFSTVDDCRDPQRILLERMARFTCKHCGAQTADDMQGWMSSRGVWVPKGQWIDEALPLDDRDVVDRWSLAHLPARDERGKPLRWQPKLEGEAPRSNHRGYRIWAANLNPDGLAPQRSWSHMMAFFASASQTKDPARLQVFVNSWLSNPWKQTLRGVDEDVVRKRIGEHEPGWVPARAKFLVAGVDVQESGYLVWAVWAVGPGPEYWHVEHGRTEVVAEDYQGALATLQRRMMAGWPVRHQLAPDGRQIRMRPYQYAVDTGFAAGDVYEASRSAGFLPVKGRDDAPWTINPAEVEGKLRPEPIRLYHVNRMVVNARLHRLLTQTPDQAGGLHLHVDTDDALLRELCAEELRRKKGAKKATWQKKSEGRVNDQWDAAAYILAVLEILAQTGQVDAETLTDDAPRLRVFIPGGAAVEEVVVDERPPPVAAGAVAAGDGYEIEPEDW